MQRNSLSFTFRLRFSMADTGPLAEEYDREIFSSKSLLSCSQGVSEGVGVVISMDRALWC
jgi:hypothetical protein